MGLLSKTSTLIFGLFVYSEQIRHLREEKLSTKMCFISSTFGFHLFSWQLQHKRLSSYQINQLETLRGLYDRLNLSWAMFLAPCPS